MNSCSSGFGQRWTRGDARPDLISKLDTYCTSIGYVCIRHDLPMPAGHAQKGPTSMEHHNLHLDPRNVGPVPSPPSSHTGVQMAPLRVLWCVAVTAPLLWQRSSEAGLCNMHKHCRADRSYFTTSPSALPSSHGSKTRRGPQRQRCYHGDSECDRVPSRVTIRCQVLKR